MHLPTHLFITFIVLFNSSAHGFQLPKTFLAEYRLEKYNTTIAEMSLQLSRENQQYIYTSVTHPYGLASLFSKDEAQEISTLNYDDEQQKLYLQSYEFQRKQKTSKNQYIELSWSEQDTASINSEYGNKKSSLKHQGMLWDRLSMQLALMDDLRRSIDLPMGHIFSYQVVDKNGIEDYRFSYEGKQNIQLGQYHYHTVKLKRVHDTGSRVTLFWLATELDLAPVKVEQFKKNKLHLNMELVNFSRQTP